MKESTVEFIFKRENNIVKNFNIPSLNEYIPDTLDLVSLCKQKGSQFIVNLPQVTEHELYPD